MSGSVGYNELISLNTGIVHDDVHHIVINGQRRNGSDTVCPETFSNVVHLTLKNNDFRLATIVNGSFLFEQPTLPGCCQKYFIALRCSRENVSMYDCLFLEDYHIVNIGTSKVFDSRVGDIVFVYNKPICRNDAFDYPGMVLIHLEHFDATMYRLFNRFNGVFYKNMCRLVCKTDRYDIARKGVIDQSSDDIVLAKSIMLRMSDALCLSDVSVSAVQPFSPLNINTRHPSAASVSCASSAVSVCRQTPQIFRGSLMRNAITNDNHLFVMQPVPISVGKQYHSLTKLVFYTSFQKRIIIGGSRIEGVVDKETVNNSIVLGLNDTLGRVGTVVKGSMVLSDAARVLVLVPNNGTVTLDDMIHVSFSNYNVFMVDNVVKLVPGMIIAVYDPLTTVSRGDVIGKCPMWIMAVLSNTTISNDIIKHMNNARDVFHYNVLNRLGTNYVVSPNNVYPKHPVIKYRSHEECASIHIGTVSNCPDVKRAILRFHETTTASSVTTVAASSGTAIADVNTGATTSTTTTSIASTLSDGSRSLFSVTTCRTADVGHGTKRKIGEIGAVCEQN